MLSTLTNISIYNIKHKHIVFELSWNYISLGFKDCGKEFQKLGERTTLFPGAAHVALTATATKDNIKAVTESLSYRDPLIV